MKQIVIILFAFVFLHNDKSIYYYHKEVKFGLYFAITKEYQLKLKEDNQFEFNYQLSDTRYKNKHNDLLKGVFEYRNDTLLLTLDNYASKKYSTKKVSYLYRGDSLNIVDQNIIFPNNLKQTSLPIIKSISN